MSGFKIRTDLAVELKDGGKKSSKIEGITVREDYEEEGKIKVTRVIVENAEGAEFIGKPIGNYITLESKELGEANEGYHRNVSKLLAEEYFEGFTRKNYIQAYQYNLHLRPKSMLVEAGAQTNTVQEKLNAMELLAKLLDLELKRE